MRQLIAQQRNQLAYHEGQIDQIQQGLTELEALLEQLQESDEEAEESTLRED